MATVDTSSIQHLLAEAEAARSRGDYDTFWRLKQQYLNEQARLYQRDQAHQQRQRTGRR